MPTAAPVRGAPRSDPPPRRGGGGADGQAGHGSPARALPAIAFNTRATPSRYGQVGALLPNLGLTDDESTLVIVPLPSRS